MPITVWKSATFFPTFFPRVSRPQGGKWKCNAIGKRNMVTSATYNEREEETHFHWLFLLLYFKRRNWTRKRCVHHVTSKKPTYFYITTKKPNVCKTLQPTQPRQERKQTEKYEKSIKICLGVFLLSFFFFWKNSKKTRKLCENENKKNFASKVKSCHTKTFAKTYAH